MGRWIDLETPARPGPRLARRPDRALRSGAVVVMQEIFGVNAHIRSVADRFADAGFVALAPALFDPVEHGVELGYDDADVAARRARWSPRWASTARWTSSNAAAELLQTEGLRVGVVGFCWGGSVAFLANTRLWLPAVSYYGARSVPFLDEPARAPLMFHFGARRQQHSAGRHRAASREAAAGAGLRVRGRGPRLQSRRRPTGTTTPPAPRSPGSARSISSRRTCDEPSPKPHRLAPASATGRGHASGRVVAAVRSAADGRCQPSLADPGAARGRCGGSGSTSTPRSRPS